jgi:hypothetical protein
MTALEEEPEIGNDHRHQGEGGRDGRLHGTCHNRDSHGGQSTADHALDEAGD